MRGVPYEVFASNTNPTFSVERLWEGVDLCIKAWTTHRRPVQLRRRVLAPPQHQSVAAAAADAASADLDHRLERPDDAAALRRARLCLRHLPAALSASVRPLFDAYRERFVEHGLPGGGGVAYMPLVHTADSDSEAEAGAAELRWYLTSSRSEPHFRDPPGYLPVAGTVAAMKQAMSPAPNVRQGSLEQLREQGVLMSGTPDKVAAQIKRFYDLVGGFDHLLMMDHAGLMSHERTVRSMTLFAREVYPQIKDLARTRPLRHRAAGGRIIGTRLLPCARDDRLEVAIATERTS